MTGHFLNLKKVIAMSIFSFYLHEIPDQHGRFLTDLWDMSFWDMLSDHDYIQWLFPLNTPSNFNPSAPILTSEECRIWQQSEKLQENLRISWQKWLNFLGLDYRDKVSYGINWDQRKAFWIFNNSQSYRITRVLKCLKLLGLEKEAQLFFQQLEEIYYQEGMISVVAMKHWMAANSGDGK